DPIYACKGTIQKELPRVKALKVLSLALAGVLVGGTLHVGDAEAARKRMSKPAASSQAKQPSRYGSFGSQAKPAAPARSAAPAAPASAARPAAPAAQAAPQAGGAGSGFMGSMAGAVAGSVIGGAVVNTLFADDAVAEEIPAAEQVEEDRKSIV